MQLDQFKTQRSHLLRKLKEMNIDKKIRNVIVNVVKRHKFIPLENGLYHPDSYGNHPLSIGYNQTISQPFIVGYMIQLLRLADNQPLSVLEIGTGLGYNAAVISKLIPLGHVYSIEIKECLCFTAGLFFCRNRDKYPNITVRCGDGYHGWRGQYPKKTRFDRIIITASTKPHQLNNVLKQLKRNGILIVPLEKDEVNTHLYIYQKDETGKISKERNIGVRFVPFTGDSQ